MTPFIDALLDRLEPLCPGVPRDALQAAVLAGYGAAVDRVEKLANAFGMAAWRAERLGHVDTAVVETGRADGAWWAHRHLRKALTSTEREP